MVSLLVVSAQKFIDNWGAIRGNIIENLDEYAEEEYKNAVNSLPLDCKASVEELVDWLYAFNFRDFPATINDKGLLLISNVGNQEDLYTATNQVLRDNCLYFDVIKI